MSEAKNLTVGTAMVPLDINAMESLPTTEGGILEFGFAYRQIRFKARYDEGEAEGILTLIGDLGPLPFTAESPAARAGLGHIVVDANGLLGPILHFTQSRIALEAKIIVERPVNATHVICAVTTILVPATPYLDLIAVYIRPPLAPARAGESALRPEWRKRPPSRAAARPKNA